MAGKFGKHKVEINKKNPSNQGEGKEVMKAQPLKTIALNEETPCTNEFLKKFNFKKEGKRE